MSSAGGAPVRVRFAPAPTGFLHVGGARTALFNWLFARHCGGVFVLRIEDTDVERSRTEWTEGIQATLEWLGLDWDEGPYLQSTRRHLYLEAAQRLLDVDAAYECFCGEEELAQRTATARAAGVDAGYDGRCRSLTAADRRSLVGEGRPRSIRFRTPDAGVSAFTDLVRGEVSVDWATVGDFVIVRSFTGPDITGAPVFFLANAVDDADMGITHVIRGEDLLDSTHRILALRAALRPAGGSGVLPGIAGGSGVPPGIAVGSGVPPGIAGGSGVLPGIAGGSAVPPGIEAPVPVYAHLPLLVGADRAKLSKRHGAVALEDFAAAGYLPEALRNHLGLLGFSLPGDVEVAPTETFVAAFDLGRVARSAAFFDHAKLDWMNGEYIRALPPGGLAARALPFAEARYGAALTGDGAAERFAGAMAVARERATTLVGAVESASFLLDPDDSFAIGADSLERMRTTERVADVLDAAVAHLESCPWSADGVDLRPALDGLGLRPRKVLPAVYAAIEGSTSGLPLFDSIVLLGRERSLRRIRAARLLVG